MLVSQFCCFRNTVCNQKSPVNPVSESIGGGLSATERHKDGHRTILSQMYEYKYIFFFSPAFWLGKCWAMGWVGLTKDVQTNWRDLQENICFKLRVIWSGFWSKNLNKKLNLSAIFVFSVLLWFVCVSVLILFAL